MDPGEDTNVVASADAALLASLSAQLSPYVGEAYRAQGVVRGELSFDNVSIGCGNERGCGIDTCGCGRGWAWTI